MSPAFWKQHDNKLVFSSATRTVDAGDCSGYVSVINENWLGVATNVTSTLTVNISAPAGVTFYSDITCTQTTSSISIPSGSNHGAVYFVDTSTGSPAITVSYNVNNYYPISVTQSETINTNPFVWTGGGADANWTTAANWSGGVAPGATDTALFDSTCSSNCSPTINTSITVGGIYMAAGYTGTITQSAGSTITIGTGNFGQLAGTFVGSSSGDAITINGSFGLSGGTFTSTTGTLTFNGTSTDYDWAISGTPTFNANSGLLNFSTTASNSMNITPGTVTYNNVNIGRASYPTGVSGSMTISGNLVLGGGNFLNGGTLLVAGNVTSNGSYYGTNVVELTGNAAGQTVTCAAGADISNLTINTGTNPVTLSGTVTIGYGGSFSGTSGNYIVTSVGTLTTTGSTLQFNGENSSQSINVGTETYNNVLFEGYSAYSITGTMTIAGNLTFSCTTSCVVNGGTLAVAGDVSATTKTDGFGTVVELTGNAAGQTVSTSGTGDIPNLTINTGTDNVTFSGTVTIGSTGSYANGSYIVTSVGTLTTTGSTLQLKGQSWGSQTITPGTITYNNVSFPGKGSYTLTSNMTVGGTLTWACTASCFVNTNTIAVAGDVTATTSFNGGTTVTELTGNASGQTISGGGDIPNLTINTGTDAVTLSGTVMIGDAANSSGNYAVTSVGTFTTTGSTLIINGNTAGQSIQPGTVTYNNLTIQDCGNSTTYATFNSATMTVAGDLTLTKGWADSGTIAVAGNVSVGTTGVEGDLNIELTGNAAGQTISGAGEIPALTIATGTNNVTMTGTITVGNSTNYLAGEGQYIVTSVGTLTAPTTLQLNEPNATHTVEPGTTTYNNVNIKLAGATINMGGETFNISGALALSGNYTNTINSGTFAVAGNVTSTILSGATIIGSAALQFTSAGTQTVSATYGSLFGGNISVTGGGTLTLGSAISWNGAAQATTVTSGSINMAGNNLTLNSLALNGNTLTKNAGVLTVGGTTVGTGSLYGGTVNP